MGLLVVYGPLNFILTGQLPEFLTNFLGGRQQGGPGVRSGGRTYGSGTWGGGSYGNTGAGNYGNGGAGNYGNAGAGNYGNQSNNTGGGGWGSNLGSWFSGWGGNDGQDRHRDE